MYQIEDTKIRNLKKGNYVLARDDSVYEVIEVKPFGEDETFAVLRSMESNLSMLGSSMNNSAVKRVLNY